MKSSRKRITVKGKGQFPFDMLRYDSCFPARQEDVNALGSTASYDREIQLIATGSSITPERWRSFGWIVVKEEKLP